MTGGLQQQQASPARPGSLSRALDACLDALAAGRDGEALDQLAPS